MRDIQNNGNSYFYTFNFELKGKERKITKTCKKIKTKKSDPYTPPHKKTILPNPVPDMKSLMCLAILRSIA